MKRKQLLSLLLTLTLLAATTLCAAAVVEDPVCVDYNLGSGGVSQELTSEAVTRGGKPSHVPTVTGLNRYTFVGWSLTNPSTLEEGETVTLVEPTTVTITGHISFYAVYAPYHAHYVVGYPDGTFRPADPINRAAVATIIARAILPDFAEGANYGNPGGYSDVSGHWAESAIAYCSMFGVFDGMPDGTFQPDRPINRQEFALVIARLDGVMEAGEISFADLDEISDWALGGIYTAYVNKWVSGYTDGTFKPLNNIRRDEAVKIVNAYLHRGVDAKGLEDLREYVYGSAAENNDDAYLTWPDVPVTQWAYYEIIEAANDHSMEYAGANKQDLPEHWTTCWVH